MTEFAFSDSVHVDRPPREVYDLVSDVTRTGEWSPVCRRCWWDEGDGPRVGAGFTGSNEDGGRTWETHSQVVVADSGRAFGWEVAGGLVAWTYTLEADGAGTRLTESWEFRPAGVEFFHARWGDRAQAHIDNRLERAHEGIPATLAAMKRILESD